LILLNRPNGPSLNGGRILRRFVCPKEWEALLSVLTKAESKLNSSIW
jgi:hypothetical protein